MLMNDSQSITVGVSEKLKNLPPVNQRVVYLSSIHVFLPSLHLEFNEPYNHPHLNPLTHLTPPLCSPLLSPCSVEVRRAERHRVHPYLRAYQRAGPFPGHPPLHPQREEQVCVLYCGQDRYYW